MSAPKTALNANELAKLLELAYPPASTTILNELPADWRMNITQAACKFVYDDGANDNEGGNVNVPSGGSVTLTATNTGCCRAYFVLCKVTDSSGQSQTVSNQATVPGGYCGGNLRWHIVPQTQVAQGVAAAGMAIELRQL